MAEKVTTMELKVDLQCCRCYKKVKKVLCKFPREIRDQIYEVKTNTVKITVVCCNPEKIRDKICCMAGGSITSIEIKQPPPQPQPQPLPPPPPPPTLEVKICCMECYHGHGGGPCHFGRPPPCYGTYGGPFCHCWGCVGGYKYCYVSRGDCFCEENPQACSIM